MVLAQHTDEEQAAKNIIEQFFKAFHEQDSTGLKELVHPDVKMQSISTDKHEISNLSTEDFSNFVKSIVSIPAETKFEERLHDFKIQIDGALASVITSYSFYINDELSHCGVNSFSLMKENEEWKIIYIVDTRERHNCE